MNDQNGNQDQSKSKSFESDVSSTSNSSHGKTKVNRSLFGENSDNKNKTNDDITGK